MEIGLDTQESEGSTVMGTAPEEITGPAANREAAMLLFDIVKSTQLIHGRGDTAFLGVIGKLYMTLYAHPLAGKMGFFKCTGDGYLAVYDDVATALSVARSLRSLPEIETNGLRLVIHSGRVKTGPGGDPLGAEVHRLFRVEAIKEEDRIDNAITGNGQLPEHSRVVMTRAALDRLTDEMRSDFELVGLFRLKGFDKPEEIWAERQLEI